MNYVKILKVNYFRNNTNISLDIFLCYWITLNTSKICSKVCQTLS